MEYSANPKGVEAVAAKRREQSVALESLAPQEAQGLLVRSNLMEVVEAAV
jgi:hypothetical protein